MLRGTGATPSVIHAAGAPGGGVSARPNVLVVLVNTKRPTPPATASSSRLSVPVMLVSTNAGRSCEPTWGLWRVAAWRIASTPRTHSRTTARSAIEPTTLVNGDGNTSSPATSWPSPARTRTSASPRWPELPVTRIRIPQTYHGGLARLCSHMFATAIAALAAHLPAPAAHPSATPLLVELGTVALLGASFAARRSVARLARTARMRLGGRFRAPWRTLPTTAPRTRSPS